MDYDSFRHFADSWGLAALVVLFVTFLAWPFRPGAGERYRDAALLALKDDRRPQDGARDER